jgi:hypothetical protein
MTIAFSAVLRTGSMADLANAVGRIDLALPSIVNGCVPWFCRLSTRSPFWTRRVRGHCHKPPTPALHGEPGHAAMSL